jgi:hypothetical protein
MPASDQNASGSSKESSSGSSSGMKMDHGDKSFAVSNVEMVSSTCDQNK